MSETVIWLKIAFAVKGAEPCDKYRYLTKLQTNDVKKKRMIVDFDF